MDTNECRVDKLYLDFIITRFECDLFLSFFLSTFLNFFDDKFHLCLIERAVWLRTTIANCIRHPFHKFTGDTDNHSLCLKTSLLFSFSERIFTILHHSSYIRDRSRVHIANILANTTSSNNGQLVIIHLGNQGFDEFRSDIKSYYVLLVIRLLTLLL